MIYRVSYHSLTATYGPKYIEAESEIAAKMKFARAAFSKDEFHLILAVRVEPKRLKERERFDLDSEDY